MTGTMRAVVVDAPEPSDALRGVRMPRNDVLENAPLFAIALGIEIIE